MDTDCENWSQGRQLLLQRCKSRALTCLHEREYSRAFAHFIVVLTVEPAVKGELLNAFLFTLDKVAEDLEKEKQVNEVIMCYEQALEVLPRDSHVLHGLATTLFRLGYVECALSYFLKSYQANPFFTPSLYCMENLKNALVERWHFVMLNDEKRNSAYKRAINRAVEKGYNRVLDIGAGTGILSMMAADTGADKVYACEGSEIMFAVLQNVMKMNNKSIETLPKLSTDLSIPEDIPEKVNLVVTEIFDAGLFGENSLETLDHAWTFLLKTDVNSYNSSPETENGSDGNINKNIPDCSGSKLTEEPFSKVIPHSAIVYAVPVECERFRKSIKVEDDLLKALDIKLNIVPQFLDDEPYSTEKIKHLPGSCKMLSSPVPIVEANFNCHKNVKDLLQGKVLCSEYKCAESGTLDAFVVWFDLYLDEDEVLSSAPEEKSDSSCWEQAIFFALPQYFNGPSYCTAGDIIHTEFLCRGHLQLKHIKINQANKELKLNQTITMEPNLIYLLNSYIDGNVINLNLRDISNIDNAAVLDISTFPILGLKSLKDNSSNSLTVLRNQYQSEVEQILGIYDIQDNKVLFKSYEDFCQTKMQNDFLIIDPVELCGLLKKNIFEDVTMMRLQCLKPTGVVVPNEIEIYAVIVESEILKEHSKIVSDEKVAGYKISQIMNSYQCRIHQDIQFSTLPHQKLSEPIKLSQINLNTTENAKSYLNENQKTAEIEVTKSGKVTAIVYWFGMQYHSNLTVNTSDPNSLYKQAACILDDDLKVVKGEKLYIQWSLKNSCFQIGIYDNSTSVLK